ncbi:MAG: hypothetical protein ACYC2O_13885 [Microthrixaceae bacterium]
MAAGGDGATRTRGVIGARMARVLLAASASSVLTAVVALPMAYQAHEARQVSSITPTTQVKPTVLGTSTVAPSTTAPPSSTTTTTDGAPGTTAGPSTTAAPPGAGDTPPPTDTPPRGTGTGTGAGDPATASSVPWFVAPAPPDAPPTSGAVATSTVVPPTTAPAAGEPASAEGLRVAVVADLQRPIPLQDATLGQPSFVFLDLVGVAQVEFFLDGEHTASELVAPFELYGGPPLLPLLLAPGPHTVRAEVTFVDGSTSTRVATFTTLGLG